MTAFNGRNVLTANYGNFTAWREITHPVPVFAAEGEGPDGELHRGYGETEQKALVSLLEELEIARVAQPEDEPGMFVAELPRIPDYPQGSDIRAALAYIEREHRRATNERACADKEIPAQFWAEIRQQEKIKAIRTLRAATRLSLRSAKEIVDAIMNGEHTHA